MKCEFDQFDVLCRGPLPLFPPTLIELFKCSFSFPFAQYDEALVWKDQPQHQIQSTNQAQCKRFFRFEVPRRVITVLISLSSFHPPSALRCFTSCLF